MTKLFQLPILITGVRSTSDKAMELKIHTRDVQTFKPEELASVMSMLNKEYWAAFSELAVTPDQIEVGEERVDKGDKTASQRLRGVIYRLWEQSKQEQDSETYYKVSMEKIINSLKEKLD